MSSVAYKYTLDVAHSIEHSLVFVKNLHDLWICIVGGVGVDFDIQ